MKKVLFVDDQLKFPESFRMWLEPEYEVLIAKDIKSALGSVQKLLPDFNRALYPCPKTGS